MFEKLAPNICTLLLLLLVVVVVVVVVVGVLYYHVLCVLTITTWSQCSVLDSELQFSSTSFSYEVSSALKQNLEVCPDFCKTIWSFAGGKGGCTYSIPMSTGREDLTSRRPWRRSPDINEPYTCLPYTFSSPFLLEQPFKYTLLCQRQQSRWLEWKINI